MEDGFALLSQFDSHLTCKLSFFCCIPNAWHCLCTLILPNLLAHSFLVVKLLSLEIQGLLNKHAMTVKLLRERALIRGSGTLLRIQVSRK